MTRIRRSACHDDHTDRSLMRERIEHERTAQVASGFRPSGATSDEAAASFRELKAWIEGRRNDALWRKAREIESRLQEALWLSGRTHEDHLHLAIPRDMRSDVISLLRDRSQETVR